MAKEKRLFRGVCGCDCDCGCGSIFLVIKMCFFFFYNRKKHWRNRERVVNCFSLSLSSQFGPLAVALELGDTCFPTLHKSPPINFEKSGTCNYGLKLN